MYLSPQQLNDLDPIEANETVKRIATRIKLANESSSYSEDCCETKPDKFGCREGSTLCGIDEVADISDESSSGFLNPGILLPLKREKNIERHVSFPHPSPKVISDESTSGFLNRIFSQMQFACGSPNQVVDTGVKWPQE